MIQSQKHVCVEARDEIKYLNKALGELGKSRHYVLLIHEGVPARQLLW